MARSRKGSSAGAGMDRRAGNGGSIDRRRDGRYGHSINKTARDHLRAAVGGLFVGLPLLWTMEMWEHAATQPPLKLLLLFTIGKSESSLADRDLRTHFGNGRTGSSTVRRTFAALLHDSLGLPGIPRNPARPERFSNYGLSPEHDRLLTDWMRSRLVLAVWPAVGTASLIAIERAVLRRWLPPLNLKDVDTPWSATIGAARRVLAAEARAYAARSAS